jgi:hypothetical protein
MSAMQSFKWRLAEGVSGLLHQPVIRKRWPDLDSRGPTEQPLNTDFSLHFTKIRLHLIFQSAALQRRLPSLDSRGPRRAAAHYKHPGK